MVIFVVSWQFIPFHSLIYQGAVRQIPQVDVRGGPDRRRRPGPQFFSITLPQLKYTIITSSTLMVVGSLTFFDLIFVLTAGGPGDATRVLALDMYKRGFQANLMGPASAIAVILVLVGLALALLLRRLGGGSSTDEPAGRSLTWRRRCAPGPGSAARRPAAPPARPRRSPPQLARRGGGLALAGDRDRARSTGS